MFHVRVYGKDGQLRFQTWNKGESSRDMEISAALSRDDVSRVEWWGDGADLHPVTEARVDPLKRRK